MEVGIDTIVSAATGGWDGCNGCGCGRAGTLETTALGADTGELEAETMSGILVTTNGSGVPALDGLVAVVALTLTVVDFLLDEDEDVLVRRAGAGFTTVDFRFGEGAAATFPETEEDGRFFVLLLLAAVTAAVSVLTTGCVTAAVGSAEATTPSGALTAASLLPGCNKVVKSLNDVEGRKAPKPSSMAAAAAAI